MENNSNSLIVMKFGGSCLQDKDSFNQILYIVKKYSKKSKILLVTSALQKITDKLIEFYSSACNEDPDCDLIINDIYNIHEQLINQIFTKIKKEYARSIEFLKKNINELRQISHVIRLIRPSMDIRDLILSYGERLSTFILAQYFNSLEFKTKYLSSDELIITDDNFGRAFPILEESEPLITEKIAPLFKTDTYNIVCVTGFYGSTKDKKVTTFGRGGSDLTAAILAYCLRNLFKCKVIYWKDVKGFLDADPRIAEKTSLLRNISYIEAKELAFFGTKVLHPLCLDVNEKGNILSEIRCFDEPDSEEYTEITKEVIKDDKVIKAVTTIYELSMVTVESDMMVPLSGTASKLFSLLGDNYINIVFISQSSSENNITFGINFEDSKKVSFLLRNSELFGKKWFRIKIDNDISLVAVIGAGVLHTSGIAGKVFTTLGNNNINILAIAQGSSELNFTAIIERKNCKKAVNVLYDAFINQN